MTGTDGETGDQRQAVTNVLREWAEALRGDWGSIDGRSCRRELDEIADWLDRPSTAPSMEAVRRSVGICPSGQGHWSDYCDEDCDPSERVR